MALPYHISFHLCILSNLLHASLLKWMLFQSLEHHQSRTLTFLRTSWKHSRRAWHGWHPGTRRQPPAVMLQQMRVIYQPLQAAAPPRMSSMQLVCICSGSSLISTAKCPLQPVIHDPYSHCGEGSMQNSVSKRRAGEFL